MDTIQKDLSYFRLRLQELLNASFPEKAHDGKFIQERSSWTAEAYECAFRSGNSPQMCDYKGIIAKDEKLAAINFLNALKKLPGYIDQEKKKIAEIQKDLPVIQEVINGTWPKENRLSELKTELASVERKIQLSITPEATEEPKEESEKKKQTTHIRKVI